MTSIPPRIVVRRTPTSGYLVAVVRDNDRQFAVAVYPGTITGLLDARYDAKRLADVTGFPVREIDLPAPNPEASRI